MTKNRTNASARMCAILLAMVVFLPHQAVSENPEQYGTLNPEELSPNATLAKVKRGEVSMVICAQGYYITKAGNHDDARTLFLKCAEAGYSKAMIWLSQLDGNGLGEGLSPDHAKAAGWDKMAAETGDALGVYHYGLDLLIGYGVPQDIELGKRLISLAAQYGEESAITLQKADYDVRAVIPDADEPNIIPDWNVDIATR